MTIVRVKGFQIFEDRHGKLRCYHRKTRLAVDLVKAPMGTAEFLAECARIAGLSKVDERKAGTLGDLIGRYRAHTNFTDLAEQTRGDYQKVFNWLKQIDDTALVKFDKAFVVRVRDRAAAVKGRRFANYVKAVLSIIFGWGSERGFVKSNTAAGIKDIRRKKGTPEANRQWTDAERHAVLDACPPQMKVGIALMMFTAAGPKDALTLPRSFFKDGEIATRRAKTGEPVFWPGPRQ